MELLYDCFQQRFNVRGGHDCVRGVHAWWVMLMLGCAFEGGDVLLGT